MMVKIFIEDTANDTFVGASV